MPYLIYTVLVTAILLFSSDVFSDPEDMIDPDQAAELAAEGKIVSLDQLLAQHEVLTGGRMLDLELELNDDEFTYVIEVLHMDGHVSEYEFDGVTGKLLQEAFGE